MSKIQDAILKFTIDKLVNADKETKLIVIVVMLSVMICFFAWLNNETYNMGPSDSLKEQILKNMNNP